MSISSFEFWMMLATKNHLKLKIQNFRLANHL
jgi:hypothetical protein